MKCVIGTVAVVALLCPSAAAPASAQPAAAQIAEAVSPLPEDLKAGATVLTYDKATGERKVLRQGTNAIECQPKDPEDKDEFIRCYNKVMAPRRDLEAKLRAQKKTDKEVSDAVAAALKAGDIKAAPFGTMSYRKTGVDGRIKMLWVMSVPNATPESIGVSAVSQRDAALKGAGLPWLMLPGTPGAHIMIPINK